LNDTEIEVPGAEKAAGRTVSLAATWQSAPAVGNRSEGAVPANSSPFSADGICWRSRRAVQDCRWSDAVAWRPMGL